MTVQELDNAFKLYLNKVDSMGTLDFLPLERQQFLNDAQLKLARKVCSNKSQDQDEVDLRRTLSTPVELLLETFQDSVATDLPADYLHYALCRAEVLLAGTKYLEKVTIVEENELLNVLNDPFNKPTLQDPFACFTSDKLLFYPKEVITAHLTYYREPAKLLLSSPTQVCELRNPLCLLLVQLAVQLALESITDSRFQTQAAIVQATTP